MIRAILYDIDNTLTASFPYTLKLLQELMFFFNVFVPAERIRDLHARNIPFEEIFPILFPNPQEHIQDIPFCDIVLAEYRKRAKDIPYTATPRGAETCSQLTSKGMIQGAVTNRLLLSKERLTQAGYDINAFAFILAPAMPECRKPSPLAFNEALKLLEERGILKHEIAYVGDHLDDFFSARDAGLGFFAVLTGLTTRDDFLQAGLAGENILEDMGELPKRIG